MTHSSTVRVVGDASVRCAGFSCNDRIMVPIELKVTRNESLGAPGLQPFKSCQAKPLSGPAPDKQFTEISSTGLALLTSTES